MPNAKYFKYDEEYNLIPIYDDNVIEVVRCKDCSHYIEPYCARFITAMIPMNENDFCSKGKRKNERTK